MARRAEIGDTKWSKNGYHYTKCESGWRLTHHIVAELAMGRPINTTEERVSFIDGDRQNLDPSNIQVAPKQNGKAARIKKLKRQILILQEELEDLEG